MLDIGTTTTLPAGLERPIRGEGALWKPAAQIAVVDLGQPVQMTDEPGARPGIGASPGPANDNRRHEKGYSNAILKLA
jgi:hypothetical protein